MTCDCITRGALTLVLSLAACGPSARPAARDTTAASTAKASVAALPAITLPPELDRVLRDYERDWRANNAQQLSRQFTEDGFVLSNRRPPVRGRAAIAEAYAGLGGPLNLAALAYATGDTVGYIVGTFGGPDPATHTGKYVLALRRAPGGPWLIAADMDNASTRD
jgi:ketosteroid isomerase-like protein